MAGTKLDSSVIQVIERRDSTCDDASYFGQQPEGASLGDEVLPEKESPKPTTVFGAFFPVAAISSLLGVFPAKWLIPQKLLPASSASASSKRWTSREFLTPLVPIATLGQTFFVWHQHWPVLFDLLEEMHWFDYYSAVLSYIAVGISAVANYAVMQGKYKSICRLLLKLQEVDESLSPQVNSAMVWEGRILAGLGTLPMGFVLGRYIFKFKKDFPLKENIGDYAFALCLGFGEMMDAAIALQVIFLADAIRRRFSILGHGTRHLLASFQQPPESLRIGSSKVDTEAAAEEEKAPPRLVLPNFMSNALFVDERDTAKHLFQARLIHMELAEIANKVSSIYGPAMIIHITGLIFRLGVSLLVLYWKDHERTTFRIFFAVITMTYFIRFWVMVSASDGIAREARSPAHDLMKLRIGSLGPELKEEVKATIQQMSGPPIRITASGVFSLSRPLLTSIAAVLVTSTIMIGQWKPAGEVEEDDEEEEEEESPSKASKEE